MRPPMATRPPSATSATSIGTASASRRTSPRPQIGIGGAAEKGLARAQANLGNMYLRGQGVARDPAEAVIWFERAAR